MITAIGSILQVRGGELWLLFWAAGAVLYLGVCFLFRQNRTKRGAKVCLLGLLAAETAVDLVGASLYDRNGVYRNYGIGAVYGLLLWIPLLAAAVTATVKNGRRKN